MMLNKFVTALITVALSATTVSAQALTQDEAKIRSNIQSFSALADQGAYQYLGRLFAQNVVVDYTSLWGGEPTSTTNVQLMKQWAGFLPGFDTTFHELRKLDVVVKGDSASAIAEFTASHWLGETGFWAVDGVYEFKLNRHQGSWEINALRLDYKSEMGNRDILAEAPKYASKRHKERKTQLVEYR